MRRSDRAIQTPEETLAVLDQCDTIRVGFRGETYPYVVPLSFGWEEIDERVYIYVHGALNGLRHELLKADRRVCVEADRFGRYVQTEHGVTCEYESVIGFGRAERISGDEAVHGLAAILRHCGFDGYRCPQAVENNTSVWRITLSQLTGKRRTV